MWLLLGLFAACFIPTIMYYTVGLGAPRCVVCDSRLPFGSTMVCSHECGSDFLSGTEPDLNPGRAVVAVGADAITTSQEPDNSTHPEEPGEKDGGKG